jgi:hypothetical protein
VCHVACATSAAKTHITLCEPPSLPCSSAPDQPGWQLGSLAAQFGPTCGSSALMVSSPTVALLLLLPTMSACALVCLQDYRLQALEAVVWSAGERALLVSTVNSTVHSSKLEQQELLKHRQMHVYQKFPHARPLLFNSSTCCIRTGVAAAADCTCPPHFPLGLGVSSSCDSSRTASASPAV